MAIISNGTTIASGGSLSVSANPPSTYGAVGTYFMGINYGHYNSNNNLNEGTTWGGSSLRASSAIWNLQSGSNRSGTWRLMGGPVRSSGQTNDGGRICIWMRIS